MVCKLFSALILLTAFSLQAADLNLILTTMGKLSAQDPRFNRVFTDLKGVAAGTAELSYEEMMIDLGGNFAQIASTSPADPLLLERATDFFAPFAVNDRDNVLYPSKERIAHEPVRVETRDFFEKVDEKIGALKEQAYEAIMNYDISTGYDLYNADILEGINISAAYKYNLDSNYAKAMHTRVDRWIPKININAMTLLKDAVGGSLPLYFNICAEREIIFVRHFKDKVTALKALPKTPISLPVNAEKVRAMETGDFVSIPARMGINAGLSAGWSQGVFSTGASGGVLLTGEFRINIYKMDENHVRMKVSGIRSQGVAGGVSASFGINFFGYDPVVGKINIDAIIARILDTNFFAFSASYIKGEQLTCDYIFDLRDADAVNAYESLLKSTLKFKSVQVGKEFLANNHLDEIVFGDMEPAEAIFQADKDLQASQRRVDRPFMGSNYSESKNSSVKLGINLINATSSTSYVFNKVRVINQDNTANHYLYPIYTRNTGFSLLFGFWKENTSYTAFSFQGAQPDWKPTSLFDVVLTINHFDKRCREGELRDFIQMLNQNFGPDLAAAIGFNAFNDYKYTDNFNSQVKIALKNNAFQDIHNAKLPESDLWAAMLPIIREFEYHAPQNNQNNGGSNFQDWVYIDSKWPQPKKDAARLANENWGGQYYWNMASSIVGSFQEMSQTDMFQSLDILRRIYEQKGFFSEVLPRYLIELTKKASSPSNLYTTVMFGGADIQRFENNIGSSEYAAIYHNINEIIYQVTYNSDVLPR
ncbi:MAG: hypothetical protein PHW04_14615 [Candidatus Wallbacteria bacterium]|nr:hypothetical protein [Candidatus Wallbacteria bacterium]